MSQSSRLRDDNTAAGSILHGNKLTLDFRHKPTRTEVGLEPGKAFRAYERNGPMLQATLKFPTGTIEVPCFIVQASTDAAGGAADAQLKDETISKHQPKYFDVEQLFPDGASARQSLTQNAKVLGLSQAEIDLVLPQLGTGAVVPQSRVLHGLVDDWLSIEITLTDMEHGQVQADYEISIDVYHNPAIDKVVHDGVFALDLTRTPTRADLGFLDTYSDADIKPAWGKSLRARLTLSGGAIEEPVSSVSSTSAIDIGQDPSGTGPPKQTTVSLKPGTPTDVRRELLADAPALGIDQAAASAIFAAPTGTRVQKTLRGKSTSVYDVLAKADVSIGQPGAFAASVTYTFSYR